MNVIIIVAICVSGAFGTWFMRIVPTIGMISYDGSRSPARRARDLFSP